MKLNRIGGVTTDTAAFVLSSHIQSEGLSVVITPNTAMATKLQKEVQFFLGDEAIHVFPDWETLPYDQFSPHQDIISERLRLLNALSGWQKGVLIVSIETLMHRLPPKLFMAGDVFCLSVGDTIHLNTYPTELAQSGYTRVNQVMAKGEFALKGSICDIFPMGLKNPVRIELFDDTVATIRYFDLETQRSTDQVESIEFLPACEYPLNDSGISRFKENWSKHFEDNTLTSPLYEAVCHKRSAGGIEYYLPLFFENTAYLFDYLPKETQLFHLFDTAAQADLFWSEIEERYAIYKHDIDRPALPPLEAFFHPTQVFSKAKQFSDIKLGEKTVKNGPSQIQLEPAAIPAIAFDSKNPSPFAALETWLASHEKKVLFCAESAGRQELLLEHLSRQKITVSACDNWTDFLHHDGRFFITQSPFQQSIALSSENWIILTESTLFTHFIPQARRKQKTTEYDEGILVKDLSDLKIGDAVVHIHHGIGRYLGLEKIAYDDTENECITIEYKGGDKLFVPISDLGDITLYSGSDMQYAPISKLGTDKWSKDKEKAAKKIRDTAAELLAIYAKREAKSGFSYAKPGDDYARFTADFQFEETPDQLSAIQAVIDDMHGPKPMDRLLCGDVGFGKTEVAMRSAFIAVHNQKQVAILVPTTLLAQQHYESFSDRFANWPVNIELLSRFRTAAQQKTIMQKAKDGQVDILIGTHKILSKELTFKNLGLLIVDEEHRFGVRHKERIKAMRTDVDILTMTATPIPRTLNMAFSSLRDLSIIATPPLKRLSVKTFVKESDANIVKEAITREVHRGGQVYFLFNDVARIEAKKLALEKLLPNIKVAIGHGQMPEKELEQVMADFYHNRYHVLLCSTIIETGIDVPNANTILIEHADKFGLAQLHQLRGRVGRSHHQAYAYLLAPPKEVLTKDAKLRLQAIEESSELGAGFNIASHDLDIRGAGELLGEEQSGNLDRIGFSLYMDLLSRTVDALKKGQSLDLDNIMKNTQIEVELNISAFIPETYIGDVQRRLSFYKRIADASSQKALDELKVELVDRFGLLPDEVISLIETARLKVIAPQIGLQKIKSAVKYIHFEFGENHQVKPETIIRLIQRNPKAYKLTGPTTLSALAEDCEDKAKLKLCFTVIEKLNTNG